MSDRTLFRLLIPLLVAALVGCVFFYDRKRAIVRNLMLHSKSNNQVPFNLLDNEPLEVPPEVPPEVPTSESTGSNDPDVPSGDLERSRTSIQFCDLFGSEGGGYYHSSLRKIRAFAYHVRAHHRHLSPAECIAISGYVKTRDWWGENCEDRDVKAVAKFLRTCWTRENHVLNVFDCGFLEKGDGFAMGSRIELEIMLRNNFDDCRWDDEQLDRFINPETIEEAILVLQNPER